MWAVTNRQNSRFYARNAEEFPEGSMSYLRRQKSALLMVWAAVASRLFMPLLIFIDVDGSVNSDFYVEMLDEKVSPWVTETFGNRYIFIQDGHAAHKSNLIQR